MSSEDDDDHYRRAGGADRKFGAYEAIRAVELLQRQHADRARRQHDLERDRQRAHEILTNPAQWNATSPFVVGSDIRGADFVRGLARADGPVVLVAPFVDMAKSTGHRDDLIGHYRVPVARALNAAPWANGRYTVAEGVLRPLTLADADVDRIRASFAGATVDGEGDPPLPVIVVHGEHNDRTVTYKVAGFNLGAAGTRYEQRRDGNVTPDNHPSTARTIGTLVARIVGTFVDWHHLAANASEPQTATHLDDPQAPEYARTAITLGPATDLSAEALGVALNHGRIADVPPDATPDLRNVAAERLVPNHPDVLADLIGPPVSAALDALDTLGTIQSSGTTKALATTLDDWRDALIEALRSMIRNPGNATTDAAARLLVALRARLEPRLRAEGHDESPLPMDAAPPRRA